MRACWTFHLERDLSKFRPFITSAFTILALKCVGHPDHRAEDGGAISAGQVHDARL